MDHLERNREVFEPYVEDDESFDDYLERMRRDAEWGGNQELVAASQLYRVSLGWPTQPARQPCHGSLIVFDLRKHPFDLRRVANISVLCQLYRVSLRQPSTSALRWRSHRFRPSKPSV